MTTKALPAVGPTQSRGPTLHYYSASAHMPPRRISCGGQHFRNNITTCLDIRFDELKLPVQAVLELEAYSKLNIVVFYNNKVQLAKLGSPTK